ncbi:MAG: transcriptional regulator [Sphingomonadales bacterium 32-68-7]|nr:MAG: transcriptional regulator [Sphingomonadales bacterium 12-68-11]OYX09574.1 MAG: transcriptional regulator [Sphingomonadales bacterium 32-68-7]
MSQHDLDRHPLTGRFLMGRLRHGMTEDEKDLIEALVEETVTVSGPTVVLARGVLAERSTMLIEGYILRTVTENGRRYIVGINVPGDFVDLHSFALKRLDHDVITLGDARLGYVSHRRLSQAIRDPHLARILWFATLLDAAVHREWIVKLEQLTAVKRVAHVFCEIWHRLDLVGLGRRDGLRTPLIQADLADMCGTTAIHMNRALRQLKKEGLGEFRRGALYVPDRAALEGFAGFDPTYLYGTGELRLRDEFDAT